MSSSSIPTYTISMKKLLLTLLLFSGLFLAVGCSSSSPSHSTANLNLPWITTDTIGDFVVRQLHGATKQTLASSRFKIQFRLPTLWRFEEAQNTSEELPSYIFRRKNTDTSEKSHRDTPNGSNTGDQDLGSFDVYGRAGNLHIDTLQAFKQWHDTAVSGRQIEKTEQRTLNHFSIVYAQEADGIQSTGQYYYLETPSHVFMFGSDDIPDADMMMILKSLTVSE